MSARHIILGLLRESPSHTYEVVVRFGQRLAPWQVNRGQVYRTVTSLVQEGLLEPAGPEGASERSGPIWQLTDEGTSELERWFSVRSEDVEPLRSDLLAKLAVAEPGDARELLHAIDWYERELTTRIQTDVTARRGGLSEASWSHDIERCIADNALLHRDAELNWIRRVREVVQAGSLREVEPVAGSLRQSNAR